MAILIFGASGFLGNKLMQHYTRTKRKVVGTYANIKKKNLIKFDLENPDLKSLNLKSLNLNLNDFSHAIICSSITDMDRCKTEPEKTYRINVTGIKKLISQLYDAGIIPIFISTDYVFDGKKGSYSEQDAREPVLEYGRHKKEVEDYLMNSDSGPGPGRKYLIVRTAKLYSISEEDDSIISSVIKDLKSGKQLKMAVDQIFSPTYVEDVCKAIDILIDKKATGCYNVCPDEAISRYELAKMIKQELGIKSRSIKPCSLNDFKFEDNRPLDTSMSNKKFKELTGFRFTTIKEAIDKIKQTKIKQVKKN